MNIYLFGVLVGISQVIWGLIPFSPPVKSTLHSLTSFGISQLTNVPEEVTAIISGGYFINDIPTTRSWLFVVHHLFSLYFYYLLLQPPYSDHKLLHRILIVEASVPFLNLYNVYRGRGRNFILFVYLLAHINFRNILLVSFYLDVVKLFPEALLQLNLYRLFMFANFFWTYTTTRKLIISLKSNFLIEN